MFPDAIYIAAVAHGNVAVIAAQDHLCALGDNIAVGNTGIDRGLGTAVAHGFDLLNGIRQFHQPHGAGKQLGLKIGAQTKAQHRNVEFIHHRTQLVDRIISGAERNGLNDVGGYLKGNMDTMLNIWELQLRILNVPEKYRDNMLNRIGSVRDEKRYRTDKENISYVRVSGKSMCS